MTGAPLPRWVLVGGRVRTAAAGLIAFHLAAAAPTWETLQARSARIGRIEIRIANVFDLSDPSQDTWVGRLANTLHIRTREAVIRRMIPFRVGDPVDARLIHETARELRSYRFIKDAHITPVFLPDGTVDAVVYVRDAWTLKASIGYSRVGGQNSFGFGLQDRNILGSGKFLSIHHDRNPVQASTTFHYEDPQLLGSHWTLAADYRNLSSGRERGLAIAHPFLLLDTPWSVSFSAADSHSTLELWDRQLMAFSAPSFMERGAAGAAWLVSLRDATALRLGFQVVAHDQRYGPLAAGSPVPGLRVPNLSPRRLRGGALTFSWLQDRYRTFKDLQGMDTPEDYDLGWAGSGAVGLYSRAWGSTGTGPYGQLALSRGWAPTTRSLILGSGSSAARYLDGRLENVLGNLSASAYLWGWPHHVLAGNVMLDVAARADPENLLYLGGQEGLRGYPNFMDLGDRRWIASLEDRILTDWRWMGILRAGFVVYADAGAIRRLDGTGWSRPRSDVGAGLRFGDLKSSLGRVVMLTMAFPLDRLPGQDRYQILVGNVVRF